MNFVEYSRFPGVVPACTKRWGPALDLMPLLTLQPVAARDEPVIVQVPRPGEPDDGAPDDASPDGAGPDDAGPNEQISGGGTGSIAPDL